MTVSSQRGIIKIKNEGNFWGVYIPKTDEMLISKRMGDIKKVLFEHFNVEKMARPDVVLLTDEDEEYDAKVKHLRKLGRSTKPLERGEVSEFSVVVGRFALQDIHVRDAANFLQTTQKHLNEVMKSVD